jgi:hypothetical protein
MATIRRRFYSGSSGTPPLGLPSPDKGLQMIYCVIPQALEGDLYDKLADYYKDEPNVEVIIDRRQAERRRRGETAGGKREIRDRRRRRAMGSFPEIDVA